MSVTEQAPWQQHAGKVLVEENDFKIIDCQQCGSKHVVPLPTLARLKERNHS